MSNILLTGGAGYIGSHTARFLYKKGLNPIIYDNLSKGHKLSVKNLEIIIGDIEDKEKLDWVFKKYDIKGVIHFAGFIEVSFSMKNPYSFLKNNICKSINLLEVMLKNNVKYIVFSSSAAVYGIPEKTPIKEDFEKLPINVYGYTKSAFEDILSYYDKIFNLKFISLRYFNAAGADDKGDIGEDHRPETHLIPLVIKTALGQRDEIFVYGTDYNTKDGTAIRDYIHVNDLANAHFLALKYLLEQNSSDIFNLGNGKGFSVKEIIEIVKKISDKDFKVVLKQRREGDPAILVADSSKIRKKLNWKAKYDIYSIVKTAYKWHLKNPEGFKE